MLNVVLPWPCRSLHPNARVHWAKRARAAKAARLYAYCSTRSTGVKLSSAGRIDVTIKAHVPDRRRLTVGRLWFFWGGDAREYPGGLLRLDPAFAYAEPPSS